MSILILLVGIFGVSLAVDIELSKEGKCLDPPPKTVPFNPSKFLDPSVTLYVPLLSKYDLYRQLEDLKGEKQFKALTEKEVEKSCLTFSAKDQSTFCTKAFDGKKQCYEMQPGKKDTFIWKAKGEKDWEGESWVTKTGNDYFITANCWKNGERSFAVNAIKSKLSSEDMSDIIGHLNSLGYDSDYFYFVNYESCSPAKPRKEL